MKPKISTIERYAESDAVTWQDVGLNERDVLPGLLRLAWAAKNERRLRHDGLASASDKMAAGRELLDALDAFDWGEE